MCRSPKNDTNIVVLVRLGLVDSADDILSNHNRYETDVIFLRNADTPWTCQQSNSCMRQESGGIISSARDFSENKARPHNLPLDISL